MIGSAEDNDRRGDRERGMTCSKWATGGSQNGNGCTGPTASVHGPHILLTYDMQTYDDDRKKYTEVDKTTQQYIKKFGAGRYGH